MFDLGKLDVCFIAGTLGQGGAERQLFYITKSLKQSGARISLLCLTKGEFWENKIRALGVPIIWVGQRGAKASRLSRIIKVLREQRFQVVQSQHFYTNLYAATAARMLGMREIGAMRNNAVSEVQANGAVLGRLSLRLPRVIAANSQTAIDNAITMGVPASRLYFLPNVVDTDQFSPRARGADTTIRLITVGRLTEQKRLDRFLSIVANLRRWSAAKIKATIVGEGPLRGQLERRADDLGLLGGGVEFRGAVSDMTALYQEADILVLTSDWEGTPNVLLEAMASGLPVVATRVGGVPEIVRHGETGFLSDAQDESSLENWVLKLITAPALRKEMASRAREYVLKNHSPLGLPERLERLYKSVLS